MHRGVAIPEVRSVSRERQVPKRYLSDYHWTEEVLGKVSSI